MKFLSRMLSLVALGGLLMTAAPARAAREEWFYNQVDCCKPTLSLLGLCALTYAVIYTCQKEPQEKVNNEKNFINFLDDVVCGNCETVNGTIQEGNRVKPYIIPARGVIGKAIKYFWPVATACALTGAYLLAHAQYNGIDPTAPEAIIRHYILGQHLGRVN